MGGARKRGGKGGRVDWIRTAEGLAARVSMDRVPAPVRDFVASRQRRRTSWRVAFSGGADSLALLLWWWGSFPEARTGLAALHFNHRLRGRESDRDEAFCAEVCGGLGIELQTGRWENPPKTASESEARDARMTFFREALSADPGPVLLFGHQADDVAENLLLRLARGAGAGGLAGLRPVQRFRDGRTHARPLLEVTAAEIRRELRGLKAPWREDSSNRGDRYTRNRLRRSVVPSWKTAVGDGLFSGTGRTRMLLEEDDAALNAWAERCWRKAGKGARLTFGKRPPPAGVVRRVLHLWAGANFPGTTLDAGVADRVVAAIADRKETVVEWSPGVRLEYRAGVVTCRSVKKVVWEDWGPVSLRADREVVLPHGTGRLVWRRVNLTVQRRRAVLEGKVDCRREAIVSAGAGEGDWAVRGWRRGDRMRLLGMPGTKKLQDMFVDARIPAELRNRVPVVLGPNGEIVWVPGFPPAEDRRIGPRTKSAVQLTYAPGTVTFLPSPSN